MAAGAPFHIRIRQLAPFMAGVLVLTGTRQAASQVTASATAGASANIIGVVPLAATTANDLAFGSVTGGTNVTVANTDGARFQITGQPAFPVSVTFALPATLAGPGAATIPIAFGSTDGLLWAPFPTTLTTFDPTIALVTPLDLTGNLEIGIKGTVSPPLGAIPGTYTGSITVTVAY